MVSRIRIPGFVRGIDVFEEKHDLLPFEDAKLYGHNAAHALLGYLLREKGHVFMADAQEDPELVSFIRNALIHESGAALCVKYSGIDPLFKDAGFAAYAEDLIVRMLNPFLRDTVDRVTRDPRRKLGWNDRLIGTMRMAMAHGLKPKRFSRGAKAALRYLQQDDDRPGEVLLSEIWQAVPEHESAAILALVLS